MTDETPSSIDREEVLRVELLRLRNTYSFKLGLLITTTFFRKPWLIPLFPFLLVKMNYDYLMNRNLRRSFSLKQKPFKPSDCLLLMPTSEEGLASIERCASIARSWMNEYGAEIIIASTNDSASELVPEGCGVYLLPNPKELRGISRSHWNLSCANLLISIIDTHRPFAFILDGPYPYRGVLNALEARKGVKGYWMRPKDVTDEGLSELSNNFESTIVLSFDDNEGIKIPSLHAHSIPEKTMPNGELKILFALGYDRRQGKTKLRKPVLNHLGKMDDITLVVPNHSSDEGFDAFDTERWSNITTHPDLPSLDCAIASSDIGLVRQLLDSGVPTLCIATDEADLPRVLALRQASHEGGVVVLHDPDPLDVSLGMKTLLESNRRRKIGVHKQRAVTSEDWSELFSVIDVPE